MKKFIVAALTALVAASASAANARDEPSREAVEAFYHQLSHRERLPARFRNLHVRNFDRASAGDRAPGVCGRQPGAHQLNHLRDREAMRDHDCLGAAVAAGSEQFERAVPGRGQAALASAPLLPFCYPTTRHAMERAGMAARLRVRFMPENLDQVARDRTSRDSRR
jgi:hypothetical protein